MAKANTDTNTDTLTAAMDQVRELQAAKAGKIAALYQERESTLANIESLESQLAEAKEHSQDASVDEIKESIDRQSKLKAEIDANREKVNLLNNQIDYTRSSENFLEYDSYNQIVDELKAGYTEKKKDVYLRAQKLANELTKAGEELRDARKETQSAANCAFDLYHGKTRIRTKIEHRCTGDKIVRDKETGKDKKVNIFEDVEVDDSARISPTIGTDTDLNVFREISEAFGTRGNFNWWNV